MSTQLDNVSVVKKSNIYFDGKCVSHNVILADGTKKSVGVIFRHRCASTRARRKRWKSSAACARSAWPTRQSGTAMAQARNSRCRAIAILILKPSKLSTTSATSDNQTNTGSGDRRTPYFASTSSCIAFASRVMSAPRAPPLFTRTSACLGYTPAGPRFFPFQPH